MTPTPQLLKGFGLISLVLATTAPGSLAFNDLDFTIGLPDNLMQEDAAAYLASISNRRQRGLLKGAKKNRNNENENESSSLRGLRKSSKGGVSTKKSKNDSSDEDEDFCNLANPTEVGAVRSWPAVDVQVPGSRYVKDFQLRALGNTIEIWVAEDRDFPNATDCRNLLGMTDITDEQAIYFANEFDDHMYPTLSNTYSVAPPRDGTAGTGDLEAKFNVTECSYHGDGNRIVVLVDNIRDNHFYVSSGRAAFISGFFSRTITEMTDRNVITIDAFDWLHKTGENPPEDQLDPAYIACTEDLTTSTLGRPNPFVYEAVFGHEMTHLLSYYIQRKDTWANEGIAEFSTGQAVLGYTNTNLAPTDDDFDNGLQIFTGFAVNSPNAGGPEQSLTSWREQGVREITSDYGCAHSFMLYLAGRFGTSFISEFHNDPNATNLEGLQALLITSGIDVAVTQLIKDWSVALTVAGEITKGAVVNGLPVEDLEMPFMSQSKINWSNPQAYSSPGAPNNGADFVRLRDDEGVYLAANDISTLTFIGSPTYPVTPVEWVQEEVMPALYSGSGNNFDRSLVRQLDIPASGAISLDLSWEMEEGYDFFFLQVYDEALGEWVSLESQDTTFEDKSQANTELPGLTGSSGGEIVKENFDAKAYAGQRVYLALRYVTDRSTIEDGVRFYGMELDGVSVADATDVSTWNSSDEIFPVPVEMWHVTLVAYTPDGGVVWANSLPLENNKVTLDATDFKSLIGTDASVVSAVVTVIESSATIVEYALYELYANSSLQPGGI